MPATVDVLYVCVHVDRAIRVRAIHYSLCLLPRHLSMTGVPGPYCTVLGQQALLLSASSIRLQPTPTNNPGAQESCGSLA